MISEAGINIEWSVYLPMLFDLVIQQNIVSINNFEKLAKIGWLVSWTIHG